MAFPELPPRKQELLCHFFKQTGSHTQLIVTVLCFTQNIVLILVLKNEKVDMEKIAIWRLLFSLCWCG